MSGLFTASPAREALKEEKSESIQVFAQIYLKISDFTDPKKAEYLFGSQKADKKQQDAIQRVVDRGCKMLLKIFVL